MLIGSIFWSCPRKMRRWNCRGSRSCGRIRISNKIMTISKATTTKFQRNSTTSSRKGTLWSTNWEAASAGRLMRPSIESKGKSITTTKLYRSSKRNWRRRRQHLSSKTRNCLNTSRLSNGTDTNRKWLSCSSRRWNCQLCRRSWLKAKAGRMKWGNWYKPSSSTWLQKTSKTTRWGNSWPPTRHTTTSTCR